VEFEVVQLDTGRKRAAAGRADQGGVVLLALGSFSVVVGPGDAVAQGCEGGEAHRAGLDRIAQAPGQPISRVSLACELRGDRARVATVPEVVDIVLTTRLSRSA